jgi:hypothetical protein
MVPLLRTRNIREYETRSQDLSGLIYRTVTKQNGLIEERFHFRENFLNILATREFREADSVRHKLIVANLVCSSGYTLSNGCIDTSTYILSCTDSERKQVN